MLGCMLTINRRDTLEEVKGRRIIYALVLFWSAVACASFAWDYNNLKKQTIEMVANEARAYFAKDQQVRLWATSHGGVYVRPDDRTPPNPYLSTLPDRDVVTSSGMKLTLMNPAYILRQIMTEYSTLYVRSQISSLNPVNPANAPDAWQRAALESFEKGATEALEISEVDGAPYMRLIKPVIVEEGCLKCHLYQGYKAGDIRGALSVSVFLGPAYELEKRQIAAHLWVHLIVWGVGLIGIALLSRSFKRRESAVRACKLNEEKYMTLFNSDQIGVAVVDAKGGLLDANLTFSGMLGYSPDEIRSKTFRDISHPGELEENLALFKELIEGRRPSYSMEKRYIHRLGHVIWGRLSVFGIFDADGRYLYGFAIINDITKNKEYEEEIERSLEEKSTLLKEVHHRVKNNLAIVLSLLDLQSAYSKGTDMSQCLGDTRSRIRAMALVHEHLYRNRNLSDIGVPDYLNSLLGSLAEAFCVDSGKIALESAAGDISLPMDLLIPCGLIINELVTNALKHAFKETGRGMVRVSLDKDDSEYTLQVRDNGSGMPEDIDITASLGLQLVHSLVGQIEGSMEVDRSAGTTFTIRFTGQGKY